MNRLNYFALAQLLWFNLTYPWFIFDFTLFGGYGMASHTRDEALRLSTWESKIVIKLTCRFLGSLVLNEINTSTLED